jgi:hypothetical protein
LGRIFFGAVVWKRIALSILGKKHERDLDLAKETSIDALLE